MFGYNLAILSKHINKFGMNSNISLVYLIKIILKTFPCLLAFHALLLFSPRRGAKEPEDMA
jgi:hypothetical protein